MRSTTLKITSSSGFTLIGDLTVRTRSQTALIYLHGLGSHRRGDKARALAAAAYESGWAFAAVDFHGHGQSGGSLRDLRCTRLQQDLDSALDTLRGEGLTRFYLVGSSMGGWAATWLAKRHGTQTIPAIAVLAPAFRFPHTRLTTLNEEQRQQWQREGTYTWQTPWMTMELSWDLMVDAENFPLDKLIRGWSTPMRIYHGGLDDIVPWRDSLEVFEKLGSGPWSLDILADGDHRLTEHKNLIMRQLMDWFAQIATQ